MACFFGDEINDDASGDNGAKALEELGKCEKERDENLQGWQRAKADFANYKKDESVRVQMMVRFANEQFAHDLLSVIDSFELGLEAMKGNERHEKGFVMIKGQFEEILKKHGVERISAKPGEVLDVSRHEPLIEVESEFPQNTVVKEVASGFSLNGRVIRPVKVSISKGQT